MPKKEKRDKKNAGIEEQSDVKVKTLKNCPIKYVEWFKSTIN